MPITTTLPNPSRPTPTTARLTANARKNDCSGIECIKPKDPETTSKERLQEMRACLLNDRACMGTDIVNKRNGTLKKSYDALNRQINGKPSAPPFKPTSPEKKPVPIDPGSRRAPEVNNDPVSDRGGFLVNGLNRYPPISVKLRRNLDPKTNGGAPFYYEKIDKNGKVIAKPLLKGALTQAQAVKQLSTLINDRKNGPRYGLNEIGRPIANDYGKPGDMPGDPPNNNPPNEVLELANALQQLDRDADDCKSRPIFGTGRTPPKARDINVPGFLQADNTQVPTYRHVGKGFENTYITVLDPKRFNITPMHDTNGETASAKNPNPLLNNHSRDEWLARALAGQVPGIKSTQPLLMMVNAHYLESLGDRTRLSFGAGANRAVVNTGGKGVNEGKVMMVWSNGKPARIKSTSLADGNLGTDGRRNQADFDEVKAALGRDENLVIGWDVSKLNYDAANKPDKGTFVGVTKQGEMVIYSAGNNVTPLQARAQMIAMGCVGPVMALDLGSSTSYVTTRADGSHYRGIGSDTNRRLPGMLGVTRRAL
jgi:hypothetical protein